MQYNNLPNMRVPQGNRGGPMASSQFVFPNQPPSTQTQNVIKKSMIFPQKANYKQFSNNPSFLPNKQPQNVFRSMIFNPPSVQTTTNFQNPFFNCKQPRGSVEDQLRKKDEPPSFLKTNYQTLPLDNAGRGYFYKKLKSPEPLQFKQSIMSSGDLGKGSSDAKRAFESAKQVFSPINPKRIFEAQNQSPNYRLSTRQSSERQKQKDSKQNEKSTVGVSEKSLKVPEFLKKSSPLNSTKKESASEKANLSQTFILQKVSTELCCTSPQSSSDNKTIKFQPRPSGYKNYVQTQNSFSKTKNFVLSSSQFAKISNTPQSNPVKGEYSNFQFGRLSSPSSLSNRRRIEPTFTLKQFSLQDFQLVDKIGKGAFGDVFISRQKMTGFLCVLKKVSKKKIKELKLEESVMRQIKIQSHLAHKHLTSLYGFFDDEEYLYLILQILPDGSMSQVKKKRKIPEKQVSKYVRQVCEGLRYMHKEEIIHRDLKPENIFLNEGYLKIGDFGCAIYTNTLRKTLVGCLAYISPEQLNNDFYDDKIDVWSVGILTYELLTGKAPFEQNMAKISRQQMDASHLKLEFPQEVQISETCKDFIRKLLQMNPNDRMDIDDTMRHPFITKGLDQERKQEQQMLGMYQAL